jgi:peptidylprolyl isomerase
MRRATTALAAVMGLAISVSGLAGPTSAAAFAQPGPGDWRPADAENTLVIDTNQGRIIAELVPESAPLTVERLKTLTRQHFYDGLTFFRVIDDFMDQTGDPKNTGEGGSTLPNLPGEFIFRRAPTDGLVVVDRPEGLETGFLGALPVASQPSAQAMMTVDGKVGAGGLFCPGVVGMARANDPDSANSQFFLMRGAHDALNGRYAAFGRVLVGLDVVKKIKIGEPVPPPQDRMIKVQVLADMPAAERPNVRVIDTKSAYFTALAAQAKTAGGSSFSICDVEVAAEAK